MQVTFLTSKQISRAATPLCKPCIPHQHATHPVHQLQRSVPNSHLATPTSTQTSNTCLNTPLTYPLSSLPPSNISSPSALGQSFARNRLAILSCSSHQLPPQLLSDGIRESKKTHRNLQILSLPIRHRRARRNEILASRREQDQFLGAVDDGGVDAVQGGAAVGRE